MNPYRATCGVEVGELTPRVFASFAEKAGFFVEERRDGDAEGICPDAEEVDARNEFHCT